MADFPEDEGPHVVRRDEPDVHLLYSAVSKGEPQTRETETPERFRFLTPGRISLVAGTAIFIALLAWSGYLIRQLHREIGVPDAGMPSAEATAAPSEALPAVTDEMLHVTSIALGNPRLVIVNGKRLAEGDSLEVKTSSGIGTLRLMSIEDGVVHFKYGGQIIDAKLMASAAPTKPR